MPNITASYGALTLTSRRQDDWGNWSEATADAVFPFPAIPAGAQVGAATLTIQVGQDPICGAYMTVDGQSVRTSVGTYAITIQVAAGTSSRTVRVSFKGTGKTYSVSQVDITSMTLTLSYVVPMSAWALTKTQAAAGEEIGVSITPATATARHRVTYAFGSQEAAFELAAGVNGHSFAIPMAWCAQIPNATYGTGTVTLQTLDSAGNVLGTESKPFTMVVPESVAPTLTGLSLEGIDLKWGLYLQGVSGVKATAEGAAGAQGSSIRAYAISGGGYSAASDELTTGPLATAGVNTFRATVTDSRGRVSAAKEATVTVTAYSPAALTEVNVARCLESGAEDDAGTYLRCVVGYQWTAVGENACLVRISARAAGADAWVQLYEGTPESGSALVLGAGTIWESSSWEVLVQAADAIGADQVIRKVPTAHTFFLADPQNDSFAFGCYPEGSKRLRLAEDWGLYVHGKELGALVEYKVGDIFLTTDSESPAARFGGSWEKIEGRFLLGANSTYSNGGTGGSTTHAHTVNSHNHTTSAHTLTLAEIPSHTHPFAPKALLDQEYGSGVYTGLRDGGGKCWTVTSPSPVLAAGGGGGHSHGNTGNASPGTNSVSHMPPWYGAYIWRKVA